MKVTVTMLIALATLVLSGNLQAAKADDDKASACAKYDVLSDEAVICVTTVVGHDFLSLRRKWETIARLRREFAKNATAIVIATASNSD